mmetsp:Transcript_31555/g.37599  ORF Transcript_31555/g.37599 Transcript_31555/m.37599 type:complete len:81 (+) Transcript_31555:264-506(+)
MWSPAPRPSLDVPPLESIARLFTLWRKYSRRSVECGSLKLNVVPYSTVIWCDHVYEGGREEDGGGEYGLNDKGCGCGLYE